MTKPIPPKRLEIGVLKKDGWLRQLANEYDKDKNHWIDSDEMPAFQKAAEAEDTKREKEFYQQQTSQNGSNLVCYNSEYRSIFGFPDRTVEPLPPFNPRDSKKTFRML